VTNYRWSGLVSGNRVSAEAVARSESELREQLAVKGIRDIEIEAIGGGELGVLRPPRTAPQRWPLIVLALAFLCVAVAIARLAPLRVVRCHRGVERGSEAIERVRCNTSEEVLSLFAVAPPATLADVTSADLKEVQRLTESNQGATAAQRQRLARLTAIEFTSRDGQKIRTAEVGLPLWQFPPSALTVSRLNNFIQGSGTAIVARQATVWPMAVFGAFVLLAAGMTGVLALSMLVTTRARIAQSVRSKAVEMRGGDDPDRQPLG
jgi:hypothetical protein